MKRMFTLICVAIFGVGALAGCKGDVAVDTDGKASTPLNLPR